LGPIIAHGAGDVGLQIDLQHALAGLAVLPDEELSRAAWKLSHHAMGEACGALGQADRRRVRDAAARVLAAARSSSGGRPPIGTSRLADRVG
jgi:uncharacterized membrane protein